jgi:chromosome segregation and condensation protein ScpB
MKPYKKSMKVKSTLYRLEYKVESQGLKIRFWDEGYNYYIKRRNKNTIRYLLKYQVRMYRTWKHNRKTKWK